MKKEYWETTKYWSNIYKNYKNEILKEIQNDFKHQITKKGVIK